jgi:hypothetical protein
METIVVERAFDPPRSLDEIEALKALEEQVAWCLEQYRVKFLHTYVSLDGGTMVCFYAAPDAESVRRTQDQAGLPVLRAWPADLVIDTGADAARPGLATVIIESALPAPTPRDEVIAMFSSGGGCYDLHRARVLRSYQSLDRTRLLCVLEAPDAESVRIAGRSQPAGRTYGVTFHTGPRR